MASLSRVVKGVLGLLGVSTAQHSTAEHSTGAGSAQHSGAQHRSWRWRPRTERHHCHSKGPCRGLGWACHAPPRQPHAPPASGRCWKVCMMVASQPRTTNLRAKHLAAPTRSVAAPAAWQLGAQSPPANIAHKLPVASPCHLTPLAAQQACTLVPRHAPPGSPNAPPLCKPTATHMSLFTSTTNSPVAAWMP